MILSYRYQNGNCPSALYNFSVNHVYILHRPRRDPLMDGDLVEVVSTISGGW